nr:MAG TPA: hypothetical protein [Caudoviricetes sp.]
MNDYFHSRICLVVIYCLYALAGDIIVQPYKLCVGYCVKHYFEIVVSVQICCWEIKNRINIKMLSLVRC